MAYGRRYSLIGTSAVGREFFERSWRHDFSLAVFQQPHIPRCAAGVSATDRLATALDNPKSKKPLRIFTV
jgi:hypothetical protein